MACYKRELFINSILGFLFFVAALEIVNICVNLSLGKKDEVKKLIDNEESETPIYELEFSILKPSSDKKYIESFYEFRGREETQLDNEKVIYSKTNITKIYQHYFIYRKDERAYIDYLLDFY